MRISDNGVGFDPDRPELLERNGLTNMRTRAEEVSGHCAIESRAGAGTTIELNLPVNRAASSKPKS
jgi:signal transduction histidine kinase